MQEVRGSNPLSSTRIFRESVLPQEPNGEPSLLRRLLALGENRAHCGGAGRDDGLELVPVDLLDDDRRLVPDQVGDRLDGSAVVAEDRDERVP
jgi:hypothetical protein